MKQIPSREAIGLLRAMTRVLCAVGVLALAFTTVNVTRFATGRDVPLPIAILLDPMIGTALAGVLYVDARLASWGIDPPGWSTTLRWGAGCTAALMNSWESLWPDGQIGWPRQADPAAVLLHLTPALLLIALTETIAAYRRCVTDLLDRIGPADPDPLTDRPDHIPPAADGTPPPAPDRVGPHMPGHACPTPRPAHASPPGDSTAADGDVWARAIALDDSARTATGRPVSIWRLRTDLRVGPRRARQIRDQLLARPSDPPPE
ncbi:extensin [Streptomyces sp. NPDC007095]|uniref:extensin n=1 Tax=Streptomyces sp. NPDC007095 TaxID=3154482 RepID=UPI0033DCE38E